MPFKNIAEESRKTLKVDCEPRLVHKKLLIGEIFDLNEPCMSDTISCSLCGCASCFYPFWDQHDTIDPKRVWMCGNVNCVTYNEKITSGATTIPVHHQRAQEWPLFCEINGIGDLLHDVKFEKINQSPAKLEFMRKFLHQPQGIIFMIGEPGLGKTYASLGMCELFTRKNKSCFFITGNQLLDRWVLNNKMPTHENSLDYLSTCSLLIIDDFGTHEPSEKFMRFVMELINTRGQWSNRGTVISTNLNPNMLSKVCGQALSDRLKLSQVFDFTGVSRRVSKPL